MTKPETTHEASDRLRAFAQKVVSVPKAVIDRREAAYRKQREGKRKARA